MSTPLTMGKITTLHRYKAFPDNFARTYTPQKWREKEKNPKNV